MWFYTTPSFPMPFSRLFRKARRSVTSANAVATRASHRRKFTHFSSAMRPQAKQLCGSREAIREAGLEFEIVPGVTAASATAASAQMALTDRRVASQLIFVSAHRHQGEFEQALQSVPHSGATLVI